MLRTTCVVPACLFMLIPATTRAQELLSLEILGPTEVLEHGVAEYQCIAHFDIGDADVTAAADWSVDPPELATIEHGVLTVDELAEDTAFIVSASWTFEYTNMEATFDVNGLNNTLISVAIIGPEEVVEQAATRYTCEATFELGDPIDVTELVEWSVEPPGSASVDGGMLQVNDLETDALLTLSAAYTVDDAETIATLAVDAIAMRRAFKLIASDGAQGDEFGRAVAIDGSMAIVGAAREDDMGEGAGAAYLFDVVTGQQLFKLLPDDGASESYFGSDVALRGDDALVGSPWADGQFGAAYLFDAPTGALAAKLAAPDGEAGDWFGGSVGVADGVAIVGARGDDDRGENAGAAYVFDTLTGAVMHKLVVVDGAAGDMFGYSVAIDRGLAAVGAPNDNEAGLDAGSVYIFDVSTGEMIRKLYPADLYAFDEFGSSIAMRDGLLVAGAYRQDVSGPDSGAVYLFDAASGEQLAKLLPDDGTAWKYFGRSVGIGDGVVIVGASRPDGFVAGAAYLFDTTMGRELMRLLPEDDKYGDFFGYDVGFSGTTAIVGAFWDDEGGIKCGAAYLYGSVACPADVNDDGFVNVVDFVAFQQAWMAGDAIADCNGDGEFNQLDFVCFQEVFLGGCE